MKYLIRLFPVAFLIGVIAIFTVSVNHIFSSTVEQEKSTLEKALTQTITQCYALEGAYPPDIDYLVAHYGLRYNTDHFFIDYQYIGGNLRPDVTIIERGTR